VLLAIIVVGCALFILDGRPSFTPFSLSQLLIEQGARLSVSADSSRSTSWNTHQLPYQDASSPLIAAHACSNSDGQCATFLHTSDGESATPDATWFSDHRVSILFVGTAHASDFHKVLCKRLVGSLPAVFGGETVCPDEKQHVLNHTIVGRGRDARRFVAAQFLYRPRGERVSHTDLAHGTGSAFTHVVMCRGVLDLLLHNTPPSAVVSSTSAALTELRTVVGSAVPVTVYLPHYVHSKPLGDMDVCSTMQRQRQVRRAVLRAARRVGVRVFDVFAETAEPFAAGHANWQGHHYDCIVVGAILDRLLRGLTQAGGTFLQAPGDDVDGEAVTLTAWDARLRQCDCALWGVAWCNTDETRRATVSAVVPEPSRYPSVKRWDGEKQGSTQWAFRDSLRRHFAHDDGTGSTTSCGPSPLHAADPDASNWYTLVLDDRTPGKPLLAQHPCNESRVADVVQANRSVLHEQCVSFFASTARSNIWQLDLEYALASGQLRLLTEGPSYVKFFHAAVADFLCTFFTDFTCKQMLDVDRDHQEHPVYFGRQPVFHFVTQAPFVTTKHPSGASTVRRHNWTHFAVMEAGHQLMLYDTPARQSFASMAREVAALSSTSAAELVVILPVIFWGRPVINGTDVCVTPPRQALYRDVSWCASKDIAFQTKREKGTAVFDPFWATAQPFALSNGDWQWQHVFGVPLRSMFLPMLRSLTFRGRHDDDGDSWMRRAEPSAVRSKPFVDDSRDGRVRLCGCQGKVRCGGAELKQIKQWQEMANLVNSKFRQGNKRGVRNP
jgi:hypothetical protein